MLVTLSLNSTAMTGRVVCSKSVRINLPHHLAVALVVVAAALVEGSEAVAASAVVEVALAVVEDMEAVAEVMVGAMVVAVVHLLLLLVSILALQLLQPSRTHSPITLLREERRARSSTFAMYVASLPCTAACTDNASFPGLPVTTIWLSFSQPSARSNVQRFNTNPTVAPEEPVWFNLTPRITLKLRSVCIDLYTHKSTY